MISDIDKDGSGTIDFDEFLQMMTAKMGERDSREEIMKAFRLFDDDETGKISFKNLKRVAKELGENMTDEELMEMIEEARYAVPCGCNFAAALGFDYMQWVVQCFLRWGALAACTRLALDAAVQVPVLRVPSHDDQPAIIVVATK